MDRITVKMTITTSSQHNLQSVSLLRADQPSRVQKRTLESQGEALSVNKDTEKFVAGEKIKISMPLSPTIHQKTGCITKVHQDKDGISYIIQLDDAEKKIRVLERALEKCSVDYDLEFELDCDDDKEDVIETLKKNNDKVSFSQAQYNRLPAGLLEQSISLLIPNVTVSASSTGRSGMPESSSSTRPEQSSSTADVSSEMFKKIQEELKALDPSVELERAIQLHIMSIKLPIAALDRFFIKENNIKTLQKKYNINAAEPCYLKNKTINGKDVSIELEGTHDSFIAFVKQITRKKLD